MHHNMIFKSLLILLQITFCIQLQAQDIQAEKEEFLDEKPVIYQIDSEQSYIHIYTGTAGFLKGLSHKHQIAIRDFQGEIVLDGDASIAQFSIRPLEFLVDADEERALAIDEAYQSKVASWIKTGTKKNMNGKRLLEADLHPLIHVVVQPKNLASQTVFAVEIKLKGAKYQLDIPGSLQIDGQRIVAAGDVELSHRDLGLKPFSIPGGASKVADKLRFVFDIQAVLTEQL